MKNIFLFACVLLLFSCDTRKDFYKDLDLQPTISIRKLDKSFNVVSDYVTTINDSFKISQETYNVQYKISDDQNIETLNKTTPIIGNGALTTNVSAPGKTYLFKPNSTGFMNFTINVEDSYNKSSSAIVNLSVFDNLLPIALVNYTNTAVLDPYEFTIYGDQSYDQDLKFGGGIINYEFSISPSYHITTPNSSIKYIFPTTGIYQVGLRVQDNDSIWSGSKVVYITVN